MTVLLICAATMWMPATSAPLMGPIADTLSVKNFAAQLRPGINLGNTLEAIPTETSWGNPLTQPAYFKAVRKAGFKSVRIPAAYSQYAQPNHKISPQWLARVQEVVDMALEADLYVMLNVHWDGGWLQPTYKAKEASEAKLRAFWQQLAATFKDYDSKLLFAGTNEVMVEGDYGPPTKEYAEVQNGYNQLFVNTVREIGGKNENRFLVVQGFNTNIGHTVKFNSVMPKDTVKDRLAMEIHYYDPYNFTLNEKSDVWQWGKNATDPKVTDNWGGEAHCDEQFKLMKTHFVDKGVPVILGEYAAMEKPKFPDHKKYQLAWVRYVTQSAAKHGAVPMLWDIGLAGGLFNRTTGAVQHPEMVKAIVSAAK